MPARPSLEPCPCPVLVLYHKPVFQMVSETLTRYISLTLPNWGPSGRYRADPTHPPGCEGRMRRCGWPGAHRRTPGCPWRGGSGPAYRTQQPQQQQALDSTGQSNPLCIFNDVSDPWGPAGVTWRDSQPQESIHNCTVLYSPANTGPVAFCHCITPRLLLTLQTS
jgi:hypothetical protein